jgi:anti-sigma factor RsiW
MEEGPVGGEATTSDVHPDLAELDACRTGEADPAVRRHVESCGSCRERMREVEAVSRLVRHLAGRPSVDVPPEVDRAVHLVIRRRAGTARRPVRRTRRRAWAWAGAGGALAAAAAVVLALLLVPDRRPESERAGEVALAARQAPASPMDVDGSGEVDILDAYRMSRLLRSLDRYEHPLRGKEWDFNRDGDVDAADVEAVARRAVAL